MIKKGKWKLVDFYGYNYPSLFNLEEDPSEIYDLGNKEEYKSIVDELKRELFEMWNPQKAYEYCNWSFEHFKITKKWAESTNYEFPSVWKCKEGTNYLLSDMKLEN